MSLPLEELLVLARYRANKDSRKRIRRSRGALTAERRDDLIKGLLEMKRAGLVSSILWNDDRLAIVKAGDYDSTPIQFATAEKLVEAFRADRVVAMPPASEVKILEKRKRR